MEARSVDKPTALSDSHWHPGLEHASSAAVCPFALRAHTFVTQAPSILCDSTYVNAYTHIRPRTHTQRMLACHNDGVSRSKNTSFCYLHNPLHDRVPSSGLGRPVSRTERKIT
ncbi:unnamed protein product [Protopolystoma xenopodis]|uniref:Uncharacterized protein n=1 Tax=Protopolystoma xenopodis TaxID=117903 RepID=A0A3S5ARB9_9PLAT|nr:unnamed protein product [Protopolystoma xenopodis]